MSKKAEINSKIQDKSIKLIFDDLKVFMIGGKSLFNWDGFLQELWIPCSDELPPFGEYVLTLDEFGARQVGARFLTKDYKIEEIDSEWFWGIQSMWGKPEQVKYWMPIPKKAV